MSDQTLMRALHAHLDTLTFTPAVQTQWNETGAWTDTDGTEYGSGFKPDITKHWIRPTYLSAGDRPLTTNPIQTRAQRIYQVDCFVPEQQGTDEAMKLADAVSAHFYPEDGTTNEIQAGAFWIQINSRPEKQLLPAERRGFAGVAVLIRCFALI